MAGLPSGSPITLVVKAPNQKVDDQTIECFLDWTVKHLKTHLSSVYPSKPVSKNDISFRMFNFPLLFTRNYPTKPMNKKHVQDP